MLSPGMRLGPYEIREPIGSGGMGEVYRARDGRLERDVAIKVLPEALARDTAALGRFEREAKSLAALSHPHLLAIFDVGTEGDVAYLVTELLQGQTLRSRMAHPALSWRESVRIATGIADGLAAAHSRGIVHRDLKPENVFLTEDGHVKILDFGIARREAPRSAGPESTETATALTAPEMVIGTVGYLSPEQISGLPAEARSDLFSLGAVLYEMLSGRRAFAGGSKIETLSAILRDDPGPISDAAHPIPPSLEAVTRRCLEKNPSNRFDSARDLSFALRSVVEDPTARLAGPAVAKAPTSSSRAPVVAVVLAVAVLSLAVLGVVRTRGTSRSFESLAVLPFSNLGSNESTAYLSDGITDSLIDRFSRLPGLRVASTAAVLGYKGKATSAQQAGRELKAEAVLTGSVEERDGQLRVAVELVDARDGRHIWGERYVRKAADAPGLEPEIAREIVDSLKFKISGTDGTRLANQFTQNAEAYQLYLKGRYYWRESDLDQARDYFEKAIAKDPSYALAYAGLADTYSKLGHDDRVRPVDAFPRARAAALEALKIDSALVEARVALSGVHQCFDFDQREAERELRQAIALQPDYALAHRRYALLLEEQRRFDEALVEIRRTLELEPYTSMNHDIAAGILLNAGRAAEAAEESRRAAALEPGEAEERSRSPEQRQERVAQAIAAYEKTGKADPDAPPDPGAWADLGYSYGVGGRRKDAERILRVMDQLSAQRYVPAGLRVVVYAGLGDRDLAFEWVDKGLADREALGFLNADPRFESLRADPRFPQVLRRLGLS